jgi:DNA repair exonuclease SbcCD ATPase subunit
MRIEKCEISRYRKLGHFVSSFKPGINLIKGPNEAGKSTLVDALTDALFENPKSKKKDVKTKTSWGYEQDFQINLDFESEGLSYSLTKDFDSGEVRLLRKSTGETLDDRKRVECVVSESIGMSNKEIFLATSCIRQDEMSRIANSPDAIKDRLEALITGGKEEALASKVIEKIETRIKELKKQGPKDKGEIKKIEDERVDIVYELGKAAREIDAMKSNRARVRDLRAALEETTERLTVSTLSRKNARMAADVTEDLARYELRFDDLRTRINNIKSSEKDVTRLRKEIGELPQIERMDVTIAEEQTAQKRFLDSKHESAAREVTELTEMVDRASPSAAIKAATAISLMGGVASLVYWYRFTAMANPNLLLSAGICGLLFLLFANLWTRANRNCTQLNSKFNMKKVRLEEIEGDLSSAQVSVDAVLGKYGFKDVESMKDAFEKRRELEVEIKNEVRRYEEHLGDKSLRELEDELKTVTREIAVQQDRLRDLKLYAMTPESLAALETAVDSLEERRKKIEYELRTVEQHLGYAESGVELQASLEERLEENDTQLARKRHLLLVLEKTREMIELARKNVLKSTLKQLDDETSEILKEVTGGKYSQVRFDRQSLKFEVFSTELGDWVDPEICLSRGTIDQLYLAARLAIVRIISEDHNPVIILDDPFVTFDETRRRNALAVLKRMAERYQIFLLTCHDHYDGITESVTTLT